MPVTNVDTLKGVLELTKTPAKFCWTTPLDFVKALIGMVIVKFPVNPGNNFIVQGFQTPGPDDVDKMWARFGRNREWLGWYAFIKSQWRKVYDYDLNDVLWRVGVSTDIPAGFQLIGPETPGIGEDNLEKIVGEYVETAEGSGVYSYFAVRWVGY